jgi:hypothetical protein
VLYRGEGRAEDNVGRQTGSDDGGEERGAAHPGQRRGSADHQAGGPVVDLTQQLSVTERRRQQRHCDGGQNVAGRDAGQQLGRPDLYLEHGEHRDRDEQRPGPLRPALGEQAAGQ